MTDNTLFIKSLEHWAKMFRLELLSDEFAQNIAQVLEDKARELREKP